MIILNHGHGLVCSSLSLLTDSEKNLAHWSSKLQTEAASDICTAKLYAINAGLRIGIGFRNLLAETGVLLPEGVEIRVPILSDNSSAVMIADPNREKEEGKKTTAFLI